MNKHMIFNWFNCLVLFFGLSFILGAYVIKTSRFTWQTARISSLQLSPPISPLPPSPSPSPSPLPPPPPSSLSPPPPPPPSPPYFPSTLTPSPSPLQSIEQPMHEMEDDELIQKALMISKSKNSSHHHQIPKIAFMFLVRWEISLAPIWEKFFAGHQGLYSIYVHSHPSFNESMLETKVFHGRRIPSKEVQWGEFSMIEAERRLLASALLDVSNQRFILLSESCIPLFDFPTIYSYLMNSTTSFVEIYDSSNSRGRYNHKMRPTIKLKQWRKGSQWMEVDRFLAIQIISDRKYFPLFTNSCIADEHYIPTFVNIKFAKRNANRSVTWADWSEGGVHPRRFIRTDVTLELLMKMRNGTTCQYNGKPTNVCFLFARKFLPNTLVRLLKYSRKLLGFG